MWDFSLTNEKVYVQKINFRIFSLSKRYIQSSTVAQIIV